VGPFPETFQRLSSGFIADPFATEGFRTASLLIGSAAAALLALSALRGRRNQLRHGMETEPFGLFVLKIAVFAGLLVFFSYMMASYKGLPNVLIVMALLIVAFDFVTSRTTLGRRIYALGGNEKAARLSGIKTERLSFYAFVNMGVLSALAGLIFAARLNTATPKSGGVGKVMGAVIGAFVMGVMNNGMSIMGIGIDYQQVIKGLVLLSAVFVDVYNKNK
jgi:putative multiple sugar transport system permease protein